MQAAELVGIDVASFMKTIHEKGIGALASKPITLNFLLNFTWPKESFRTGK